MKSYMPAFLALVALGLVGSLESVPIDMATMTIDEVSLPLLARQSAITGTVARIDDRALRLTVRTDEGRTVSLPIQDHLTLDRLHEGDRIEVQVLTDQDRRAVQVIAIPNHRAKMTI